MAPAPVVAAQQPCFAKRCSHCRRCWCFGGCHRTVGLLRHKTGIVLSRLLGAYVAPWQLDPVPPAATGFAGAGDAVAAVAAAVDWSLELPVATALQWPQWGLPLQRQAFRSDHGLRVQSLGYELVAWCTGHTLQTCTRSVCCWGCCCRLVGLCTSGDWKLGWDG